MFFLCSIHTNIYKCTTSGLCITGNTRKHHQIDVYIYQCGASTMSTGFSDSNFYIRNAQGQLAACNANINKRLVILNQPLNTNITNLTLFQVYLSDLS